MVGTSSLGYYYGDAMAIAVVVGGGPAGLLSARILKRDFDRVLLVDNAEKLGGLCRSFQNEYGDWFDFGTHFLAETGVPDLDEVLLSVIDLDDWHSIRGYRASSYMSGKLNLTCNRLNANTLPADIFARAMIELLMLVKPVADPSNLREELEGIFGELITEWLLEPVIEKVYGVESSMLAPGSHLLFNLDRITGFDVDVIKQLKMSPVYSAKLNYYDSSEYPPENRSFYPKEGGIGKWVSAFESHLIDSGVEIHKKTKVARLEESRLLLQFDRETEQGSDETWVDFDRLIWTIPPAFGLHAAGLPFKRLSNIRPTSMIHLVFDQPYLVDSQWTYVFEPSMHAFRVTFYSNIQGEINPGRFPCTVEILSELAPDPEKTKEIVHRESIRMGFVSPNSQVLYWGADSIPMGFPVPTLEYRDLKSKNKDSLESFSSKILCLGRAAGNAFFTVDVLKEVWSTLLRVEEGAVV